ncbi:hypothetical protein [Flavobacterium sp. KACC 22763]|uniref:hypothetical protein n=1 Tax=Flavobacterium sp. KACC 22763 TaxID=3025668 RepID=UPI0023669E84|nr:hypothetical protein [Flavobacterium sp. KACC 22763]WDF62539.1 hypothetical protein PQ463_12975 [Flavobacterium sp. KACC 22763]
MKKNLFCMWLMLIAILFSANTQAQMTIGGKKEPEAFSVLELLNKGGLRLPQMTTAERDAFAVKNNEKGNGLTIYNKTTNCVEYWNASRWVSLCDGTSQATISPQPCINVAADGSGCDQTFKITDPDCPNGPFNISIVAGGEYASLVDVDNANGSFKINFFPNETINLHTVLVRVTSTCTSLYKEFLFSQNGVDCSSMSYAVPTLTASGTVLCADGSVYLSVPANTANLDKLIWTRNGIEVARGVNYYIATQKGKYNISMGAVGCNTNAGNEKNITESTTVAPASIAALASNNGVLCGTNSVTLSASGTAGSVVWFHNGVEEKSGLTVNISGDSSVGDWFAAVKDGSCYSKQSNTINVTKSAASVQITVPDTDILVNGKPLNTITSFCAGGSLDLSIANKQSGITYTWYNGNDVITVNPFIVPASQSTMTLRMIATDNTDAKCPAEAHVIDKNITSGNTPSKPTINSSSNSTRCTGSAVLTVLETGTYTWYKDNVKMSETAKEITVTEDGTYGVTITNASGCTSPMAVKTILGNSSAPVISWNPAPPAQATYNSVIDFSLTTAFNPTSYVWTKDGVVIPNITGQTATITLPSTGSSVKIGVTAKNDCGEQTISQDIALNDACPTPVITTQPASQSIIAKTSVTVKVAASGNNTKTYQWFRNTSDSTTGGTPVGNAISYTTADLTEGIYYFYCIVTNGCTGNPKATSQTAKITVTKNPADIPLGTGTLSGKTCFDVVQINNNADCGTLASRSGQKADFSPTYTYTFTPQGTVTNFHFTLVETVGAGNIVESYTTSGYTVTVKYKADLYNTAKGLSTADAFKLTIYAIFNDGTGTEKAVNLTAQIKDCMCCGAMISPTEWRGFMCHNLGADRTLDPFTLNTGLIGSYYQWGTSTPAVSYVNFNSPAFRSATTWVDASGKKTANDPCDAGYHIPTKAEWQGLIDYYTTNSSLRKTVGSATSPGLGGVFYGTSLMLPTTGIKTSTGTFNSQSTVYQTSAYTGSNGQSSSFAPYQSRVALSDQNCGMPIRCIADK